MKRVFSGTLCALALACGGSDNSGGKNLSSSQRKVLEAAKGELRKLYGRKPHARKTHARTRAPKSASR